MDNSPTVVKSTPDYCEPFDLRKLFNSIYLACVSVRTPVGEAELTAKKICGHIEPWLSDKTEITSGDIRTQAAKHLKTYNPDAAYLYLRHRIIE